MFPRLPALAIGLALFASAARTGAQDKDKAKEEVKPAPSKVVAVTVYANTALVTREVTVPEAAGLTEVVVSPLPPFTLQSSLYAASARLDPKSKDRGVRKAPFVVLIGASMPSVLAEISFISNPRDASALKRGEGRQRIAEALYKGVSKYSGTLSHFDVARRGTD